MSSTNSSLSGRGSFSTRKSYVFIRFSILAKYSSLYVSNTKTHITGNIYLTKHHHALHHHHHRHHQILLYRISQIHSGLPVTMTSAECPQQLQIWHVTMHIQLATSYPPQAKICKHDCSKSHHIARWRCRTDCHIRHAHLQSSITECTVLPHTNTHNHFTAIFPGLPGWAGARREASGLYYGAKED